VNSITVTPQLQHVIDRAYPGLSPRQQASKIRGLIHEILLDMILASGEPGTPGRDEFRTSVLPCAGDGLLVITSVFVAYGTQLWWLPPLVEAWWMWAVITGDWEA
jgi:hypothetical protein